MAFPVLEDLIPTAELTAFARDIPVRADFILTAPAGGVLPTRVIDSVKYRSRAGRARVSAAKFRAFNAPTPWLQTSAGESITEGFLPPLGGKQAIEEFQSILHSLAGGGDTGDLIDALYTNVENQALAVHARLEVAAGDLLENGALTIEENGVILSADFGTPSANKVTAAVPWSSASANRLAEEQAWMQVLADAGATPSVAITSRTVAAGFATNASYKAAYWGTAAGVADRPALSLDQVNSVRGQYGLVPLRISDHRVDVDGVSTRVLSEGTFLLLPASGDLGSTTYGRTAEANLLLGSSNPRIERTEASGIISTASLTDDPVSITTKTTAVAMPVLDAPAAFVTAQVL